MINSSAHHATALLDPAPQDDPSFSIETGDGHRGLNLGRLRERLFGYVSAARFSSSKRQRWEAVHAALHMLYDASDALSRSVTVDQLDQLFSMDAETLQSVIPQLVYYVLTVSGPVSGEVRAFLMRTAAASPAFGYEIYWFLSAQPRRTVTARTGGAPPPAAEEPSRSRGSGVSSSSGGGGGGGGGGERRRRRRGRRRQ